MLWYLPLEPLEGRYTVLMDRQLARSFTRRKVSYRYVCPEPLTSTIETGAFLDANGTIHYKASQIRMMAEYFRDGRVSDGDHFFISDLWFPGIEALKYMAYFAGLTIHVWGIIHAGSYTDTDYVRGMSEWAQHSERGWLRLASGVFVGSRFHKDDLISKGRCDASKIHATGLVYDTEDVLKMTEAYDGDMSSKKDRVVFAGRVCDEKQPWVFDAMAERFAGEDVEFVKTADLNLSKEHYFDLLWGSKAIFSAALQENFGYSVLEATTLGCRPVVPDRLAYRDIYPEECRYNSLDQAESMIRQALDGHRDFSHIPVQFNASVDRMLDHIRTHRAINMTPTR